MIVRPGKDLRFATGISTLVGLSQSTIIRVVASRSHNLHIVIAENSAVRFLAPVYGPILVRNAHGVPRAQGKLGVVRGPFKKSAPDARESLFKIGAEGLRHGASPKHEAFAFEQ